jgi:hypothetical protein
VILAISAAVDGCAVAKAGPSIDQSLRGGHHRRRKIHNRPAREHWGDNPSLQTPLLALGAQEAVVQSRRQYPALEAILPIVWGVVAQNAADGAGSCTSSTCPNGSPPADAVVVSAQAENTAAWRITRRCVL